MIHRYFESNELYVTWIQQLLTDKWPFKMTSACPFIPSAPRIRSRSRTSARISTTFACTSAVASSANTSKSNHQRDASTLHNQLTQLTRPPSSLPPWKHNPPISKCPQVRLSFHCFGSLLFMGFCFKQGFTSGFTTKPAQLALVHGLGKPSFNIFPTSTQ